jgi:tRNA splicing ligase
MKRADRQDSSRDNALNHPQSRQQEPISPQERAALVMTLRGTLTEKQQELDKVNQQLDSTRQEYQSTLVLYQEAQIYLPLYNEEKTKNISLLAQLSESQQQFQQYFSLYNEEKTNSENLVLQIQSAQAETQKYLTLYVRPRLTFRLNDVLKPASKVGKRGGSAKMSD